MQLGPNKWPASQHVPNQAESSLKRIPATPPDHKQALRSLLKTDMAVSRPLQRSTLKREALSLSCPSRKPASATASCPPQARGVFCRWHSSSCKGTWHRRLRGFCQRRALLGRLPLNMLLLGRGARVAGAGSRGDSSRSGWSGNEGS